MGSGKVVLGVLAGAAAGAILGILLAPDKGSKTRKQLIDKSDDFVEGLKAKYEEFCDTVTQKFDSAKKDAEDLADKGNAKYDEAKKDVKNATSEAKHAGA